MGRFTGRVLLLCPRHSKLGEMIAATVRQAGPDVVAFCPQCLEDGKEAMLLLDELSPELFYRGLLRCDLVTQLFDLIFHASPVRSCNPGRSTEARPTNPTPERNRRWRRKNHTPIL